MKIFAYFILLVLLTNISYANEAHDRLVEMTTSERNKTFGKLLRDSGESCNSVTRSFFQGFDKDNAAYWSVACSNDRSFSVQFKDDSEGSTRIVDCELLKMLGVNCFEKF
ncbi:MAG: hypothetical protein ACE5KZ_16160 [Candidatus Scalinduaceae bacterium]